MVGVDIFCPYKPEDEVVKIEVEETNVDLASISGTCLMCEECGHENAARTIAVAGKLGIAAGEIRMTVSATGKERGVLRKMTICEPPEEISTFIYS